MTHTVVRLPRSSRALIQGSPAMTNTISSFLPTPSALLPPLRAAAGLAVLVCAVAATAAPAAAPDGGAVRGGRVDAPRPRILGLGVNADVRPDVPAIDTAEHLRAAWLAVRDGDIVVISTRRAIPLETPGADEPALASASSRALTLANSIVASFLSGAARDAADAAVATDSIDFAIRKGYVTTIGRVPPGIDNITGDLGATRCDTTVRPDGSIGGAAVCAGAPH